MNDTDPAIRLNSLAEAWQKRHMDRFPSFGSHVGLTEYDARLEAPDRSLIEQELSDARTTLREFEKLPKPAGQDPAGTRLDHLELDAQLRLSLLHLETIGAWRRNPADSADQLVTSLFYLLMRRDVDREETAEAIAARLEGVPAYLQAVKSRIDDPVALWVDVALDVARGGADFFGELARGLAEKHPRLATRLGSGAARAGTAMSGFVGWLEALKSRPLATDPAIGARSLREVVRLNHGLTETLEEISEFGWKQIKEFRNRQAQVVRAIDPAATPAEILKRENRRYAESGPDLLAEYRRITTELRDRLVQDGVLDLPPAVCDVISTPAFLRAVLPTAAYSAPGPFDKIQRGIFYVSDPPPSLPRADYLAQVAQHFPLEATCAHEAFPGHHVQLCWANHAPSFIRRLADHIIFMEGWTLYCEQLMIELKYVPGPVYELAYLNDQLWRACRVVIDAGVQSGTMTVDQAVAMLEKEVGFTHQRARTELNWYTQSPGTPMSYLLGKGKTLALREIYLSTHPGASLKEFHNWLLKQGSVPQSWLLETMS